MKGDSDLSELSASLKRALKPKENQENEPAAKDEAVAGGKPGDEGAVAAEDPTRHGSGGAGAHEAPAAEEHEECSSLSSGRLARGS